LYFCDRGSDVPQSRGHLNPGSRGVELERFDVGRGLSDLVRHVWIARWQLQPGEINDQRVLAYPTFNLVIMNGTAALYGPDPRLQVRRLSGRGWALGLLLRPAAGVLLTPTAPRKLVGKGQPVNDAPIDAVERAMGHTDHVARLAALISLWLGPVAAQVDEQGRLVNRVSQLAEEDATIVRVTQLARRAGVSPRSLERLVVRHIGVTPKWLIDCRRMQEAATTLHARPDTDLTALALSLDYADYAHFSRRYKEVLGETPDRTRAVARTSRPAAEPAAGRR
jgi:AraC-like DNA-binding protein